MATIARIDAALARIETAATKTAPAPGGDDAALAGRHERLRAATADALARLDRLIERTAG